MSQSTIKPRSVRRQTRGTGKAPVEEKKSSKKSRFILVAVILAVLGITIGIGYYFIYVVPLQYTIIKVNDAEIKIDYFIRRMLMPGSTDDIFTMIDTITNEELIRQVATKPPYNIKVTDDELMAELRASARGENETISDAEFKSWYRDQRNESGLSDKEYKELSRTYIMMRLMSNYLAERVSSVAEQVHLHMILVSGYEETTEVLERLEAGEDFITVAQELSADAGGGEQTSDLGWWPLDALGIKSETIYLTPPEWMFNLGVGAHSEPTLMDQESQTYAIFMVSERSPAREIDAEKLDIVKGRQLEMWLDSEAARNTITLHGRNDGFDSETHAWISWQISRRLKAE